MGGSLLETTWVAEFRPLSVAGGLVWQQRDRLAAHLAATLTLTHAALFALPKPQSGQGRIAWWSTVDGPAQRYVDCDAPTRAAIEKRLSDLLADIRAQAEERRGVGESGVHALAELLDEAIEVPGLEYIHVVGGQPVLAAWGHVAASGSGGVLHQFTPAALPLTPAQRALLASAGRSSWNRMWLLGGLTLLALLLLLVPLGMYAVPWLLGVWGPAPLACSVPRGELDLWRQLAQAQQRESELRNQLAGLGEQAAQASSKCQPQVQAAVPPDQTPPGQPAQPLPTPQPKPPPLLQAQQSPELSDDGYRNKDISILKGCWDRITDLKTIDVRTGQVQPVKSWQMCFDGSGNGYQDLAYENGTKCNGRVSARFADNGRLEFQDQGNIPCRNGWLIFQSNGECERVNDTEASCSGTQPATGAHLQWSMRPAGR